MLTTVDIFRVDREDERPLWLESAATLDGARERVKELMNSEVCEYMIFDQATQSRTSIKPEDDDWPSPPRNNDQHSE